MRRFYCRLAPSCDTAEVSCTLEYPPYEDVLHQHALFSIPHTLRLAGWICRRRRGWKNMVCAHIVEFKRRSVHNSFSLSFSQEECLPLSTPGFVLRIARANSCQCQLLERTLCHIFVLSSVHVCKLAVCWRIQGEALSNNMAVWFFAWKTGYVLCLWEPTLHDVAHWSCTCDPRNSCGISALVCAVYETCRHWNDS